jgi:hypothetical protein
LKRRNTSGTLLCTDALVDRLSISAWESVRRDRIDGVKTPHVARIQSTQLTEDGRLIAVDGLHALAACAARRGLRMLVFENDD